MDNMDSMDYLEERYTPEQIDKAKQINKLISEHHEINQRMKVLSMAADQMLNQDTPDDLVPELSGFPLAMMLRGARPGPHPIFLERYKLARVLGDEREESVLTAEISENMLVEVLLLSSDARLLMEEIRDKMMSL